MKGKTMAYQMWISGEPVLADPSPAAAMGKFPPASGGRVTDTFAFLQSPDEAAAQAPQAVDTPTKTATEKLKELLGLQGSAGNWDYDPYMHGMYNGMELALAVLEDRSPEYKKAPTRWIAAHECDEHAVVAILQSLKPRHRTSMAERIRSDTIDEAIAAITEQPQVLAECAGIVKVAG